MLPIHPTLCALVALSILGSAHAGSPAPSAKSPAPVAPAPKSGPMFGDKLVDIKVFVLDPGVALFRANINGGWFKDDPTSELVLIPEVAIGLGHGFELSMLGEWVKPKGETTSFGAFLPELRYALAPWGELPLNPTLGLGYEFVPHDPDVLKSSLYLSEELGDNWFWAGSFTYQKRTGGDRERELIGKMGLHYIAVPNKLSVGLEMKYEHAQTYGEDASSGHEFLLGPALIWRATDNITLRLGSEFGTTSGSPKNESTFTLEYRF
jgi:hypothetical protein